MKSIKDLLSPERLAEKMEVSRDIVDQWKKDGMPYVQIGKIVRISETSFMCWWMKKEKNSLHQDAPQREFFGNKGGNKES